MTSSEKLSTYSQLSPAVVTGGTDGIGLAIAEAFAAEGRDVYLVARDLTRLEIARERLATHGNEVYIVQADLADVAGQAITVASMRTIEGSVGVLVNNVGIADFTPLTDLKDQRLDAMLAVNIKVPLLLTQALLPALKRGPGCVINITSYWADKMVAGRPSAGYSATRGAQIAMTRALANELGPDGIRVNAIAPGAIRTTTYERDYLAPMTPAQRSNHEQHVQAAYPLGRIGEPEDIGQAARYLASSAAKWVTGTVHRVDGGLLVR